MNAPATFECLMEKVLKGIISKGCQMYLDDGIIYGSSFDDVMNIIKEVLERFEKYNLKLKAKKCEFFIKEVKFFGHRVSMNGITTNTEEIKIQTWPTRTIAGHVRSFLGLMSYYR